MKMKNIIENDENEDKYRQFRKLKEIIENDKN